MYKKYHTKSLKPHLLKIKEEEFGIREKESIRLSLVFNWKRIKGELGGEGRKECQILLGIVQGETIEYYLFKCRNK